MSAFYLFFFVLFYLPIVYSMSELSWSKNGRYVLTSSKDWNVVVWDLAARYEPMQRLRTVRFDSPVVSAGFHPRNR